MLAASHTHAGPAVADLRGMGAAPPETIGEMERRIVDSVVQACGAAKEVSLGIGSVEVDGASVVREGKGRDQTPEERELKALSVTPSGQSRPSCVLYNFACHAVALGSDNYRFSADYPGEVRRLMRQKRDSDFLFFQGACGDINPAACRWDDPRQPTHGTEELERLGALVASKLEEALEGAETLPAEGLASADLRVKLPTAGPKSEVLESALREAEAGNESGASAGIGPSRLAAVRIEWARTLRGCLERRRYPNYVDVPVQLLRIGGALFVGIGAELFSRIGLDIKEGLGRERTFVSAYANGCIGYISSKESYDTSDYAVHQSAAFYDIPVLARDAGTVLAEEVLKAAAHLRLP
jgi:hypothetical protein